ncbi:triosephosphate isomerase, partial [Coniella lustricola]
RRLVGVSTKMYFSAARTSDYISSLVAHLAQASQAAASPSLLFSNIDIFVIPDHLTLAAAVAQLALAHDQQRLPTPVLVGAQDAFWADAGAYTGCVSPAVLAELGCRIVELGHAERRALLGESNTDVARKAAAAVRNGMTPLLCIGETERAKGVLSMAVGDCAAQVNAVLAGEHALPPHADVVLAYEPVWAIGAAAPASAEHVVAVVGALRELPSVKARREGSVRIIYGGSAGPGVFEQLKGVVDGLFLGRFAHDVEAFVQTIHEVA